MKPSAGYTVVKYQEKISYQIHGGLITDLIRKVEKTCKLWKIGGRQKDGSTAKDALDY